MRINNEKDTIIFSETFAKDWRIDLVLILRNYKNKYININCMGWLLTCKDIKEVINICKRQQVDIITFKSTNLDSITSASSLGLNALLTTQDNGKDKQDTNLNILKHTQEPETLSFHKGTLRSGELLEADNDLLIVGDVNPGATVSAGGNVMIWGRLLGIAHAGNRGNLKARITALQLRPVQLRIANKVARGPIEKPEKGLAEEAIVEKDIIVIKPARSN